MAGTATRTLGFGALALILREITSEGRGGIITDEVMTALEEVMGPDQAWAVAGVLQDALGRYQRGNEAGAVGAAVHRDASPFGRDE